MEHAKNEINLVAELAERVNEAAIQELESFQLALVGGGIGDTIPH